MFINESSRQLPAQSITPHMLESPPFPNKKRKLIKQLFICNFFKTHLLLGSIKNDKGYLYLYLYIQGSLHTYKGVSLCVYYYLPGTEDFTGI